MDQRRSRTRKVSIYRAAFLWSTINFLHIWVAIAINWCNRRAEISIAGGSWERFLRFNCWEMKFLKWKNQLVVLRIFLLKWQNHQSFKKLFLTNFLNKLSTTRRTKCATQQSLSTTARRDKSFLWSEFCALKRVWKKFRIGYSLSARLETSTMRKNSSGFRNAKFHPKTLRNCCGDGNTRQVYDWHHRKQVI